jgi:hypothetical protein
MMKSEDLLLRDHAVGAAASAIARAMSGKGPSSIAML